MGIGTSLGAYFDDEFHHQAGINTDPSADNNTIDPELDGGAGAKPKPKLDIMKVSDTGPTEADQLAEAATSRLKDLKDIPITSDADVGNVFPQTVEEFKQTGKIRYTDEEIDKGIDYGIGVSGSGLLERSERIAGGRLMGAEESTRFDRPRSAVEERADSMFAAEEHGPSPFEQVVRSTRRSSTAQDTEDALRQIHEALNLEQTPFHPANNPGETFEELMARIDREDIAKTAADAKSLEFKDYGKIQMADRGYGAYLFKTEEGKVLPLNTSLRNDGKTIYVNWIGDETYQAVNSFSKGEVKSLFKALADKYPNAEEIAGFRVSGARSKTGSGANTATMAIPGRKRTIPPRKSIEDLSREWNDGLEDEMSGLLNNIPGRNHPDQ